MLDNKILVTGGAGFIGSNLVKKLISLGAEVFVLVRKESNLWRLKDLKDKIHLHETDFNNYDALNEVLNKINPEIVFNCMADIRVKRDPELLDTIINTNFNSFLNLVRAINRKSLKLFINFGTCEEYGDGNVPFLENQKEIPVSPYSLSKILGTYLSSYLAKIENFPIITVRPFLTYGPGQINDQLVPFIIRSMIKGEKVNAGKMEQTRDFIHVDDVVSALVKIPLRDIKKGEIINICSGKEIKVKEVVKKICELTNRSFEEYVGTSNPYRIGEMMNVYGSNEKARKILDWVPEISLEEGLKETIEWYKDYLNLN